MRSFFLGAVSAVMSGCGAGLPPIVQRKYGCMTVSSDRHLDEEAMEHNVKLAEEALRPIVKDGFCKLVEGVEIEVVDVPRWPCAFGPGMCLGEHSNGRIRLSNSGKSLAHELLHAWDSAHLRRIGHDGWGVEGFFEAALVYESGFQNFTPEGEVQPNPGP